MSMFTDHRPRRRPGMLTLLYCLSALGLTQCDTGPLKAAPDCESEPLPEDAWLRLTFDAPPCPSSTGGGVFGFWTTDERGLPAYEYTLAHETDDRALYFNSQNDDRRLHWSGFGNDRTTAFSYNTGGVDLLSLERGPLSLNHVDPAAGRWGGGLGIIQYGEKRYGTLAWKNSAVTRRRFTVDGREVVARMRGINTTHRTFSPTGDDPILIAEAVLENVSPHEKTFRYAETWDVNTHPLFFGLVSAGLTTERRKFNERFAVRGSWRADDGIGTLAFLPNDLPARPPVERSNVYPEVFAATLDRDAKGLIFDGNAAGFDASGKPFLRPSAMANDYSAENAGEAKLTLTLVWEVTIAPGEKRTLRSAFGYRYPEQPSSREIIDRNRGLTWRQNGKHARSQSVYLADDGSDWAGVETAWHSHLLLANSMADAFHGAHVFNQGSTYGYLQGINGAPRDQVLALVPTVYFRPDLAKDNLRYIMRTTHPDGQISYAAIGHGVLTGALIHEHPSDLDLFFLWGLSEYLLATRDFDFLSEKVAYYQTPLTAQSTVLDHARLAFNHLTQTIGAGAHGLLRLRDGDWSDGIILRAENESAAKERGESTFNAAMAAYVLPRFAASVTAADPILAGNARAWAKSQTAAFLATWQGSWYLRGYGDVDEPIGDTQLFLEPHVFALLAGIIPDAERAKLLGAIKEKLEDPSPIGQLVVYPPDEDNKLLKPGWDVNGGSWHAINGLLTAAYTTIDPARARRSLERNSMYRHAEAYPEIWYGIWSGADSYNAHYAKRPGETFLHIATPMTDFPVLNSNQHAMPLYAALRGYGLEATAGGLRVAPAFSDENFLLRTPWATVAGGPSEIALELKALAPGQRWIYVERPAEATGIPSVLAGEIDAVLSNADGVNLLWRAKKGDLLRVYYR